MADIMLIAHNIRSTHNVGSIFRTAEGFGVNKILLTGYTPYPQMTNDPRLPHISEKITKQIHKTALDAETIVPFEYSEDLNLLELKNSGYKVVGLEQAPNSQPLPTFKASGKIALLLGEEVEGITHDLIQQCDTILEIPMFGQKESFNVSVAAGIALYQLTCAN